MTTPNLEELNKIKSVLGEIPNYIFEYLELSDDIKKEWKYGSKASDFGGHNQFVQKFAAQIQALISEQVRLGRETIERETLEAVSMKLDELHQGTPGAGYIHYGEFGEWLDEQIAQLKDTKEDK